MRSMNKLPHLALVAVALLGTAAIAAAAPPEAVDCHVGLYRFADGRTIDLGPSDKGKLRWRRPDGTSGVFALEGPQAGVSLLGWTERPDGLRVSLPDCAKNEIDLGGERAHRVSLAVRETRFRSDGVEFAGRLVLPAGTGRVPIVVLLHGSEHEGALELNSLQRRFPAEGIGAFVYDKRGTGTSGGKYTQDFDQLARDAVAALREARRLAGARAGRIGYQGPSEGGWVAPIAANLAPVDFVVVGFGLAVSVLEEDREAVAMNIATKGHGAQAMADAMRLTDAVGALVMNPVPEVFDRFDAVRAGVREAPWFKDVHGDFSFFILPLKKEQLATMAKEMDWGTPWLYDPMATLARVKAPQLWILAQDDLDAPSAETARRLAQLRMAGRPIATAVFAHTEHGIYEYETTADDERLSTRHPDGYLQMMVDFARGTPLQARYGSAPVALPGMP